MNLFDPGTHAVYYYPPQTTHENVYKSLFFSNLPSPPAPEQATVSFHLNHVIVLLVTPPTFESFK